MLNSSLGELSKNKIELLYESVGTTSGITFTVDFNMSDYKELLFVFSATTGLSFPTFFTHTINTKMFDIFTSGSQIIRCYWDGSVCFGTMKYTKVSETSHKFALGGSEYKPKVYIYGVK